MLHYSVSSSAYGFIHTAGAAVCPIDRRANRSIKPRLPL
jgi:hypothetical protein